MVSINGRTTNIRGTESSSSLEGAAAAVTSYFIVLTPRPNYAKLDERVHHLLIQGHRRRNSGRESIFIWILPCG